MPSSSTEGKVWIRGHFLRVRPQTILDVGVGQGTYADLLRDDPLRVGSNYWPEMHGVEVWTPYVERFELNRKYDYLTLADARQFLPHLVERDYQCDAVILGDVVEHMTQEEGVDLWKSAITISRELVVMSLPIVHYPQGHEEGNPYEAHVVDNYTHARVMDTFPGITDHWTGQQIGVYLAKVW